MKKCLIIILWFTLIKSFAQNDSLVRLFERNKNELNHRGMIVLTAWSGVTIIGSATGYALTNSHEEKQFYLMNSAWGAVNLAIALPGLLSKPKPSTSIYELQKNQIKVEKLFLANALLDLVYITGGLYLKEYGNNQHDLKKSQQFNGFGNAIIIQGTGLFIFDTVMTLLNNHNRKKRLDPILKNATITFSGNSIKLGYQLN